MNERSGGGSMSWVPFTVEAPATPPRTVRSCLLVAYLCAMLVVVIGAAALLGWAADIWWLRDPIGGWVPMRPNAALMFILCGLALGLSVRPSALRRWGAQVLAVTCVALVLTTVAQDVVGRDFGIDTLLFDVPFPRPAPAACIAFLLTCAAILALDVRPRRGAAVSEILGAGVATLGWLALGGFVYGATQFYVSSRHPESAGVAINASVAMIALAVGIVATRPDSGVMAVFTSRHVGGQTVRRMLPIALAIPVLGYFAVLAQRAGVYAPPGAAVVEGVAGMVAAVAITLAVGQSLERTEADWRRLEEQGREWKRFFDRATFGAVFGKLDTTFGCVNEAFARMHGYTPAELEGRPIKDVFPPERQAELPDKLHLLEERGGFRWESEHVRKDGSVFPVVIDVSAVRDEQGRDLYRAAYVQDITQEKEAEAAQSRLASLVQSTDDAIAAIALDGTVVDWNRGAERIYGYGAAEIVGRSIAVIIPPDRRVEFDSLRDRARAGETVVGFETERLGKDGRRLAVALTLSPIRDAVGHVVGFSKIEVTSARSGSSSASARSGGRWSRTTCGSRLPRFASQRTRSRGRARIPRARGRSSASAGRATASSA
jgi:PAS domain S-box-containing protein